MTQTFYDNSARTRRQKIINAVVFSVLVLIFALVTVTSVHAGSGYPPVDTTQSTSTVVSVAIPPTLPVYVTVPAEGLPNTGSDIEAQAVLALSVAATGITFVAIRRRGRNIRPIRSSAAGAP